MTARLPKRIGRLDELANNLWWSWHHEARQLFQALDYPLWAVSGQNPIKQLREMTPERLRQAASDPAFLALYDSVIAAFDADASVGASWFARSYSGRITGPIAYFCTEFALHKSLPIYAGGLGVLAGDLCKEACDLGLPLVGVGFMYPQGYFKQRISAEGWQEESYEQLDFEEAPIERVPNGPGGLARVNLDGRDLGIGAWQVRLGRVQLYLLDTNIEGNAPGDRQMSARLYIADREQRLQQEIVLGIGGVRVLRAMGIEPSVWHANEGHTAFMALERARELVEAGLSFPEALARIRANGVFTTHTPVPAGHDIFATELMDKYFRDYWPLLGIDRESFMRLGEPGAGATGTFNMTALALRTADRCCGVSLQHGRVSRRMWHVLWPDRSEDEVPVSHVTNGVHLPTWIAPEIFRLCEKHQGPGLMETYDDIKICERIEDIPDGDLWTARQVLKRKLMHLIIRRSEERWVEGATGEQVLAMGALLNPDALTIGFVRRFAEYKRAFLLFQDIERLKRIVGNRLRPVQFVFAGKSHPADFPAKHLIHLTYNTARDRGFQGRIAFVEDYDMLLARYLVQGVDLWLNTPRRLQEACGTSGMKAALNGVPHFSVRDGWWYEGYNGANGWAVGEETADPADEDRADAESLYETLEKTIVPLYYERDRAGVPHGWMRVVKATVRTAMTEFSARRMLKQYAERMYVPAAQASSESPSGASRQPGQEAANG